MEQLTIGSWVRKDHSGNWIADITVCGHTRLGVDLQKEWVVLQLADNKWNWLTHPMNEKNAILVVLVLMSESIKAESWRLGPAN